MKENKAGAASLSQEIASMQAMLISTLRGSIFPPFTVADGKQ